MLENYVALSITNILAMLLLAFVVGRNNLLDRKMKRFFSTAIFCTILVILAEIGTSVFGQPVASFSLPNMVFNVLGFSLSPFITISLAFVFNHRNYRNIFYLFLPAVTNMPLTVLSPKFGLIFSISQQNEYFRGPCFFVYVAAYIWSMTILFKRNLIPRQALSKQRLLCTAIAVFVHSWRNLYTGSVSIHPYNLVLRFLIPHPLLCVFL